MKTICCRARPPKVLYHVRGPAFHTKALHPSQILLLLSYLLTFSVRTFEDASDHNKTRGHTNIDLQTMYSISQRKQQPVYYFSRHLPQRGRQTLKQDRHPKWISTPVDVSEDRTMTDQLIITGRVQHIPLSNRICVDNLKPCTSYFRVHSTGSAKNCLVKVFSTKVNKITKTLLLMIDSITSNCN